MDKVIILRNNLGTWTREIKRVRLFGATKVVQFEDEVTGEVFLIAPDYPADSGVYQAEFVPGSVDRFNAREAEVPAVDN